LLGDPRSAGQIGGVVVSGWPGWRGQRGCWFGCSSHCQATVEALASPEPNPLRQGRPRQLRARRRRRSPATL
jgi:hypothetical protein